MIRWSLVERGAGAWSMLCVIVRYGLRIVVVGTAIF
jgi:hypothetical protein